MNQKKNKKQNDEKPIFTEIKFLPVDAKEFLGQNGACENDYLSFNRFVKREIKEHKGKVDASMKPHSLPSSRPKSSNTFANEILQLINKRQQAIASGLPDYLQFSYKVNGRLLLGIGGATPYTSINSMKLHPLYGIPYIPASSLKGVIRHCWLHEHLTEQLDAEAYKAAKAELNLCFGTGSDQEQSATGKLIFLDAYPVEGYNIANDVITPHYKSYYNLKGDEPPRDDDFPNIISLVGIENTEFMIYIGLDFKEGQLHNERRSQIVQTVITTFTEYGIGAKTAIGYGLGEVAFVNVT